MLRVVLVTLVVAVLVAVVLRLVYAAGQVTGASRAGMEGDPSPGDGPLGPGGTGPAESDRTPPPLPRIDLGDDPRPDVEDR